MDIQTNDHSRKKRNGIGKKKEEGTGRGDEAGFIINGGGYAWGEKR
jgi:hypothetical protein